MITLLSILTESEILKIDSIAEVPQRTRCLEIIGKDFIDVNVGDLLFLNQFGPFPVTFTNDLFQLLYARFEEVVNQNHRER